MLFNKLFGFFPGSTLTVIAEVEVDKDGKSASGPFAANMDPDGQNFTDFSGTVFLSRMTFDDWGGRRSWYVLWTGTIQSPRVSVKILQKGSGVG